MKSSIVLKGAVARLGLGSYPLGLSYELTWRCNLACKYCDRHTPMPNELHRDEIFSALSGFWELGMRDINLDGGESLLHRHIEEIVEWLVRRGVRVSLNTNGILVPSKLSTVRKISKIKISLDGPQGTHDAMRGTGSFERAVAGALGARKEGVRIEFTCTVGRHNADSIEDLLDITERLGIPVVFQPAQNSLFGGSSRDGSEWQLDPPAAHEAFRHIEALKRRGRGVGNGWSSLRHFRRFPAETRPPCAAGRVFCAMDPEGVLFSCGELNRSGRSNSVVRLGVARAFANLARHGCSRCWCVRLVEENYTWGCRVDKMLPPL